MSFFIPGVLYFTFDPNLGGFLCNQIKYDPIEKPPDLSSNPCMVKNYNFNQENNIVSREDNVQGRLFQQTQNKIQSDKTKPKKKKAKKKKVKKKTIHRTSNRNIERYPILRQINKKGIRLKYPNGFPSSSKSSAVKRILNTLDTFRPWSSAAAGFNKEEYALWKNHLECYFKTKIQKYYWIMRSRLKKAIAVDGCGRDHSTYTKLISCLEVSPIPQFRVLKNESQDKLKPRLLEEAFDKFLITCRGDANETFEQEFAKLDDPVSREIRQFFNKYRPYARKKRDEIERKLFQQIQNVLHDKFTQKHKDDCIKALDNRDSRVYRITKRSPPEYKVINSIFAKQQTFDARIKESSTKNGGGLSSSHFYP